MARLSTETLEEGREYVRQQDLEGLLTWTKANGFGYLHQDEFRKGFERVFSRGDLPLGLRMFDEVFSNRDPDVDRLTLRLQQAAVHTIVVCLLLAGLASAVYLGSLLF